MNNNLGTMYNKKHQSSEKTPLRLLVVTISSVFLGEAAVMVLLDALPELSLLMTVFVDATLISIIVLPALYLWLYRPLGQELKHREETAELLKANEERLARYFDASLVGMAVVSTDKSWVDFNQQLCDILGYSQEQLKELKWTDVTFPEDIPDDLAQFQLILDGESNGYVIDKRFIHADGTIVHSTVSTEGVRQADGSIDYCVVAVLDQTDRLRAEAMLRFVVEGTSNAVGQDFFAKAVECLATALGFKYALIGRISGEECTGVQTLAVWAGDKLVDNMEYDLKGTPCEDVLNQSFCVYVSGVQREFPEDILLQQMEVESYLGTPLVSADGKPIGIIAILDDKPIPEFLRSQAESLLTIFASRATAEMERSDAVEKVLASEKKYRSYVDHAPDGIFVADRTGAFVDVNAAAVGLIGYSREELLGMSVADLAAPEAVNASKGCFDQIVDTGISSCEVLMRHKDGHRIWTLVDAGRISDDCFVIFVNDMTEHRRAEEELAKAQKLESVGILAGGLAHDFNNLLTGIVGNISLARQEMDSEAPEHVYLQDAEQAANRATDLTKQLLTFSKGGDPIKRVSNIQNVVNEAAKLASGGTTLKLQIDADDDLPRVKIDVGQIKQVIHNLVVNASQAMPDGGAIRIKIEKAVISQKSSLPLVSGDYVMISVIDEGDGISPEYFTRIFDPYFTTKVEGSGLGLASVYSIVQKHNGHVDVESTVGRGSTFRICLPAESDQCSACNRDTTLGKPGGKRVLVMDDEEVIRILMERILNSVDCDVTAVPDGEAAVIEYAAAMDQGHPYNVVILDLTVPGGLGGCDTLAELKLLDPQVKAIVCSGYSGDPVMSNHKQYGFRGLVAKPFRPADLLEAVEVLSSSDAEQDSESLPADSGTDVSRPNVVAGD